MLSKQTPEERRAEYERKQAEREAALRARIARLPVWARDHVTRLERQLQEKEQALVEARGERSAEGAVAVRDPYRDPTPVAWDEHDTIRFFLKGHEADRPRAVDVTVEAHNGGETLRVRAPYTGMAIQPVGHNGVEIVLPERF